MPPTQKELAKLAGVSSGTVSNVISGSTKVSERSRQKVLEAIRVLNYQPNLIARSLKTNRTRTLGIVVPDITIPFFPKIIRGAECAARERGYFLIVLDSEGSPERESEMFALLRAQRVEGMLLVTASGEELTPEKWHALSSAFPVVCLDRLPVSLDVDSVCVDDCGAAEMAISYLMGCGHKEIAVVTGPLTLRNEQERVRGYRQALQKGGLPIQRPLIWNGSFEQDEVARLCQNGMLRPTGRPTALFATNGVTGLAALRSLYSIGLSTPKDFAFITFDEITAEDFFRPGITSVVQPTFDMGYRAVEVLLDRIEKGKDGGRRSRVRLPATLTVRESSGTSLVFSAAEELSTRNRGRSRVVRSR
ncbi:MAG TPA: LacI family DNA-binding transcriptional regulator [Edaphobacter sp.]|jgi:DNA-binding LacI/PurR family transcriptional regulator